LGGAAWLDLTSHSTSGSPAVRPDRRTWGETGVCDEPVTPLLRQRVDLEELDFAVSRRR
jgi:hypothetical protein